MTLHKFLLVVLVICARSGWSQDSTFFASHFRLLPLPQQIHLSGHPGMTETEVSSIFLDADVKRPAMTGLLEALPLTNHRADASLVLELAHGNKDSSSEGYTLVVSDGKTTISAYTAAGLFYGIQTLTQLLEDAHDQRISIPACKIVDYPSIAYRAIHLDLKHHLDALNYYYGVIDRLASVKINAIIIEFEDKLAYRQAPKVASPDAIPIEQFAALTDYARARNIEISPLVQGLGHASFILKHPEYKSLRDDSTSDWVFDPVNPKTYELQFALYNDAILATPGSRFLHVGGDEVGALGKSAGAKRSGMTPMQLQLYWLTKVAAFAKAQNRIPIFWDDMLFKQAGLYETTYDSTVSLERTNTLWRQNRPRLDTAIKRFPTNCIYMRWNYDDATLPGNLLAIDWYKTYGLHVMAATAAQQVWPMLPRNHSNFRAISDYCALTDSRKLDGILCTSWDDASPHLETVFRGFYDFAMMSWHHRNISDSVAHTDFRHRFFGPSLAAPAFEFQDALELALPFWENGLLTSGTRNNYPKTIHLIDLPSENEPGKWSLTYSKKIADAITSVRQYENIKATINHNVSAASRNRYALEIMNQVNELQGYTGKLLLLIRDVDEATGARRNDAQLKLKQYVAHFSILREEFERVFAVSRVLQNPNGYLPDSNFHAHLANGTMNDDWMFVYELAMNKKIMQWK